MGGAKWARNAAPPTDDERRAFEKKPALLAHAKRLGELGERITYVEQPSPEGFGHAVFQAKDFAGGDPFVLLLGDHVYTVPEGEKRVVRQLADAYDATGGSVTGVRYEPESGVSVTGIIKGVPKSGGLYAIERLQEKPTLDEVRELTTPGVRAGHYLGHFGVHLFTSAIFDALGGLIERNLRVKNEFQLTSGQEDLLASGATYHALLVNGERWDIGMPDEYLKTLTALGRRGPYREEF